MLAQRVLAVYLVQEIRVADDNARRSWDAEPGHIRQIFGLEPLFYHPHEEKFARVLFAVLKQS